MTFARRAGHFPCRPHTRTLHGMGREIELEARDGHRFGAYVSEPPGAPHGAVVVLQEVFGVNRHIRGVADRFAADGWLALAPFVFDRVERGVQLGYDDADLARGRRLVNALGWDDPVRDVAATVSHAGAAAGRAAVVGFCWGGTLAFLSNTRLKVPAVSYYGGRSVPFLHERPGAPLLMHLGRRDPIVPPEHVAQIRAELREAEIHEYDAGHGFACEERKDFDARSAELAHARTRAFLERHLTLR